MATNTENNDRPPRRSRRLRLSRVILGAVLGIALAVVAWGVVLVVFYRDSMPTVDESTLAAAAELWNQNGPASYDLDLEISGRRPSLVHIEIRQGEVTAMTRDGHTPSQRRTWEYWSVPSQFDTIARDLLSAEDPVEGFGAPPGAKTVLRAEFDQEFGYPKRYYRIVLNTPLEVRWVVTRFTPIR